MNNTINKTAIPVTVIMLLTLFGTLRFQYVSAAQSPTCRIQGPTELFPEEEMQSSQGKSLKVYSNIYTQGGGTFSSRWLNSSNYDPIRLDAQGTFIPNGSWALPRGENNLAVEWDNSAYKRAGDKPSKVIITITDAQGRKGTCSHTISLKSVLSGTNLPIADSDMGETRFDNGYIIFGYAYDSDKEPNTPVKYDIYVDGQKKASNRTANEYRPDVRMNRNDVSTDNHGWSYKFPSLLPSNTYYDIRLDFYDIDSGGRQTGQKTTITKKIYVSVTSYPVGYFDGNTINPDKMEGWTWDPTDATQPLDIKIYEGNIMTGTLITQGKANIARNIPGYPAIGNHGFSLNIPGSIKDGKQHILKVYVKDYTGRNSTTWARLKGKMVYQSTTPPPPQHNPSQKCTTIPTNKFCGEYYDYYKLTRFEFSRLDDKIDFDWGTGSPDSRMGANTFSVRWQGKFSFSGETTFTASTDDGMRVWVDNDLIIDSWQRQQATAYAATRNLTGQKTIKVEYYERTGGALSRLTWRKQGDAIPQQVTIPGTSKQPIAMSDVGGTSFDNSVVAFGWAFDPDNESVPVEFDMFINGEKKTLSPKKANNHRPDVSMARDDVNSEYHGWEYPIMPHLAPGKYTLTVRLYDIDSAGNKTGGTKDVDFNLDIKGSSNPVGYFDGNSLDQNKLQGWAWDPDSPGSRLRVEIWNGEKDAQGSRRVGTDYSDLDLANSRYFKVTRNLPGSRSIGNKHGFSVSISRSIQDGNPHTLYAYAQNHDGNGWTKLPGKTCYPGPCASPPPPEPPPPTQDDIPANAYKGEYYNNQDFTDLKFTRTDRRINFDWPGSPDSRMGENTFSVRWTGKFNFTGDTYFKATADDGIRVWIDNELLIDAWKDQPPTDYYATKYLTGLHTVKVEYYENSYGATVKFFWIEKKDIFRFGNMEEITATPINAPSCYPKDSSVEVEFDINWKGFPSADPNWDYELKIDYSDCQTCQDKELLSSKKFKGITGTRKTIAISKDDRYYKFSVDADARPANYTYYLNDKRCQSGQQPGTPGTKPTGSLRASVIAAVPVTGDQVWYQGGIINGSRVNGALVAPNCSYPTAVKVKNTGTRIWRAQDGIYLKNTGDSFFQGKAVGLNPGVSVNPGETYTFYFRVTTPQNPTNYPSNRPGHGKWVWQMADEKGNAFGQAASWQLASQRFGNKYGRYQAVAEIPCIQPPLPPNDSIHVLKVFMGLNMQDANQRTKVWLDNALDKKDDNPAIFKNIRAGQHTVHMENPGGVKIFYSVCRNRTLCLGEFKEGTNATVDLPAGQFANVTYLIGPPAMKFNTSVVFSSSNIFVPINGRRLDNFINRSCSVNIGTRGFWDSMQTLSLLDAIKYWNNITDYKFNYVGALSADDIDPALLDIDWIRGDFPFERYLITLNSVKAMGATTFDTIEIDKIVYIYNTRVLLNLDARLDYYPTTSFYHLPTIIAHELGHAIGLSHPEQFEDSIMIPIMNMGRAIEPTNIDINTVNNSLYPWCS